MRFGLELGVYSWVMIGAIVWKVLILTGAA